MGSSTIANSCVLKPRVTWKNDSWKLVFNASFIIASIAYAQVNPSSIVDSGATQSLSIGGWVLAGFLIGFGTKLGMGCTSGHGVCGMARLSVRSTVAIGVSMVAAAGSATLFAQKEIREGLSFLFLDSPTIPEINVIGQVAFGTIVVSWGVCAVLSQRSKKMIGAVISAAIFSSGLATSMMVLPSKVIGFLDLSGFVRGTYDPSLIIVMGVACTVSFLSYQYKNRRGFTSPVCSKEFNLPQKTAIDTRLVLGAAIFGFGWGFSGLCPGTSLFLAANGVAPVLFAFLPTCFISSYLASLCGEKEEEVDSNELNVTVVEGEGEEGCIGGQLEEGLAGSELAECSTAAEGIAERKGDSAKGSHDEAFGSTMEFTVAPGNETGSS